MIITVLYGCRMSKLDRMHARVVNLLAEAVQEVLGIVKATVSEFQRKASQNPKGEHKTEEETTGTPGWGNQRKRRWGFLLVKSMLLMSKSL